MAEAPKRICELVETFEQHIEAYRSHQYNETQLRREFIDPLFEELGWDVTNKAGYAQAYKDVIHEDAIKVGAATKAPDYCFRIGGARKFFLEAKKPSVDIKGDPHPAYQLRRYAWSARLPLSILTDFEELAVYDCQMRPKHTDRADVARIMLFTYKDYLKSWSEIADIFSKNAILKGSFDKFAAATKSKRGTSTVDKEFLAEIEKWRNMLARIIALRNAALSVREINFCVQRTIDRILFLRMCEDRGIEPYGQLQSVSSGERNYPRLCEVFERADQKYNSGLFHFHDEPGRAEGPDELTPNIIIDDKDLKWILHSLYYPQSPYEFSVLPAEILGNVYEQFLGKVITLTSGHRASVEDKPEVKKAGGVYYTPSYIVDYIVKNTVGCLLGDPSARHCEKAEGRRSNLKPITPRQVSNIKILDPACGSGSFLIGAYQYLLDWHLKYYTENEPEKHAKGREPKIYQTNSIRHCEEPGDEAISNYRLTITEKKRILLNNIFGVDIDSQAVEVTKLSLLLKVLEGESSETLDNQYRLFHERALPDLGNNIKCGNSLIGPDFFDNLDPASVTEELRHKINAFDWHAEFPEIFNRPNPGFDAVIGNPPWGATFSINELEYLEYSYITPLGRSIDSYTLFIERALSKAREGGIVSYITPDTFLRKDDHEKLRESLLTNITIEELIETGPLFTQVPDTWCLVFSFLNRKPTQESNIIHKKIVWVFKLGYRG
jgi:type I restriction-modification system DNA methylase subunit